MVSTATAGRVARFTRSNPCPLCGGCENDPRGAGRRCFGFLSSDGKYGHCTREELAGGLIQEENGTYAHYLAGGRCNCGVEHTAVRTTSTNGHARDRNGHNRTEKKWPAYSAIDGHHVGYHVRLDLPAGKRMWWEQPDGTKHLDGFPLSDLELYGARELPPDGPVVITEGEKARDALNARGVAAVGTMTGSGVTPSDDALRPLLNRPVVTWPDNADDGRQHMQNIDDRLHALGHQDVRRVHWPEAPPKGDAADFTGTDEDLRALIAAAVLYPQPEQPRSLAAILDDVEVFVSRFVAYPDHHAPPAHTCWIAHTHAMDSWESTPRKAFLSVESGSGKTRALEVTETLVPRPVSAVNVTPAYLFRKVADEAGRPTILSDEIDTVFGPKARDNEELRGLYNAGHRRGAVAGRCVVRGKAVFTEEIPAYCAVAFAGLGDLPETILNRSIVTRMKKRAPGEQVEPFRHRDNAPEGFGLRDELAAAMLALAPRFAVHRPEMPETVTDRHADVWEPLIAIADLAGGTWPERVRCSAVAHVAAAMESTPSLGIRLLGDIRSVFGDDDAIATTDLLTRLHKIEEAIWGDIRGKALDARGLSSRVRKYGPRPCNLRTPAGIVKGYKAADFWDAWSRYLPPLGVLPNESATTATALHAPDVCGLCGDPVEGYDAAGQARCVEHYQPLAVTP